MGLKAYQLCRAIYDATFIRIIIEYIVHHVFQMVVFFRGLLDDFVVEVLPV